MATTFNPCFTPERNMLIEARLRSVAAQKHADRLEATRKHREQRDAERAIRMAAYRAERQS